MITIAIEDEHRTDAADGGGEPSEVWRTDYAGVELLQSRRREDGTWLLQGRACKAGILTYRRGGQTIRELIAPEDLADPESLATLERAVLTLEHPMPLGTMVTPSNVGALQVGDVGGDSAAPAVTWDEAGGYVVVSVCARREDAIGEIQRGKTQLSAGYRMTLDKTPGVHPLFGAYDVRQTKRRYNHVAIVDTGRAGQDVALRVDSAGNLTSELSMDPTLLKLALLLGLRTDSVDAMMAEAPGKIEAMKAAMPAEGSTRLAAAEAKVSELMALLATATAELEAAKGASATDAVTTEIGAACDAPPPVDPAAMTPAEQRTDSIRRTVRGRGAERARLESTAADLRVDAADVAKLGDAALRKKLVLVAFPTAPTDKDPSYYAARFDSLLEGRTDSAADTSGNPYADLNRAAAANLATRQTRTDAADKAAPKKRPSISAQSLTQLRGTSTEADA